MSDAQKILECISANPGLSDRQITNLIFGENYPQQKINAICRKLAKQGLIIRTMRPVKNYIKNSDDEAQPLNQINCSPDKSSKERTKSGHPKEEDLIHHLQISLNRICKSEVQIKQNLTVEELISLKSAVSSINNFITYKLSLRFVEQLLNLNFITAAQYGAMCNKIELTSSNANGFDIISDGDIKILAEVKGTVPYYGNRYGAAQQKSIIKDLINLCDGKAKSKIDYLEGYYRFMVMLDAKQSKDAMNSLIRSKALTKIHNRLQIVSDGKFSKAKINIVFIALENDSQTLK